MPALLESSAVQWFMDSVQARWEVIPSDSRMPKLTSLPLGLRYRTGKGRPAYWSAFPLEMDTPQPVQSPHGAVQQVNLHAGPNSDGLHLSVAFALTEIYPLLLWQVTVENRGHQPIFLEQIDLLQAAEISFGGQPSPAFFSNGWQSWSHSGVYGLADRPRRNRLGPFQGPMCVNPRTGQPKESGHFSGDMFGVLADRSGRIGWVVGFLSQKQHFGSLEARLQSKNCSLRLWANGDEARLDPQMSLSSDWACLQPLDADLPDPLGPYLDAVAREHSVAPGVRGKGIPTGWCSWYHFFEKVTAEDVRRNLAGAAALRHSLPLGMIQIDDGFEQQVGDWFEFNNKFSAGVSPLAAEIRAQGFTPGLWLAPFIVHPKSRLAGIHADWLLCKADGRPVNAGYVWEAFNYALDVTNPEALQYACDVVHTAAHEWGYDFLKLDFLYAAALPGRYRERSVTRAQALRRALEAVRQAVGENVHLLGCGCPLGSGIGIFDSMRISCDVAPRWKPIWNGVEIFFRDEPDMPSARNAIHNTLTRLPLHRRWWINDPDCLLLRPESELTLAEVQTLATAIALSGGTLLLSDDLSALPEERLRLARQLLPLIGRAARAVDWLDADPPHRVRLDLENAVGRWHLLAAFNWDDAPRPLPLIAADFGLPEGDYYAREFWPPDAVPYRSALQGEDSRSLVAAHGVRLLAVRAATPGLPQYLGSDLHISQGLEVTEWGATPQELTLRLERPGQAEGNVFVALPRPPQSATLNDRPLAWETLEPSCYRLRVAFEDEAIVQIISTTA